MSAAKHKPMHDMVVIVFFYVSLIVCRMDFQLLAFTVSCLQLVLFCYHKLLLHSSLYPFCLSLIFRYLWKWFVILHPKIKNDKDETKTKHRQYYYN